VGGRAADGGRLLADIKSRVRRGQPLELLLPTSGAVDDVLNEPRPEARVLRLRIVCHQCRLLDNRRSGLELYSVIVTRCRPAGGETICPRRWHFESQVCSPHISGGRRWLSYSGQPACL